MNAARLNSKIRQRTLQLYKVFVNNNDILSLWSFLAASHSKSGFIPHDVLLGDRISNGMAIPNIWVLFQSLQLITSMLHVRHYVSMTKQVTTDLI